VQSADDLVNELLVEVPDQLLLEDLLPLLDLDGLPFAFSDI